MELGAYSFGDTQRNPDGKPPAHRRGHPQPLRGDRPGRSGRAGLLRRRRTPHPGHARLLPGTVIAAAAAATKQIKLGSGASIISTDDPVRVFQQFATADAISGGGRVEITAGRGSSVETFPLFGYDLKDYDRLYAEKLDLLMTINNSKPTNVTWSGTVRPALHDLAVVPRPVNGKLPIWLATGGSAPSSARAGKLGLPDLLRHHRRGPRPVRPAGRPLPGLRRAGRAHRGEHQGLRGGPRADRPDEAGGPGPVLPRLAQPEHRNGQAARLAGPGQARSSWPRPSPRARTTSATRTKSPSASWTCTATWGTCGTSCRWTSAACPRNTSWSPSHCWPPRSSPAWSACCHEVGEAKAPALKAPAPPAPRGVPSWLP